MLLVAGTLAIAAAAAIPAAVSTATEAAASTPSSSSQSLKVEATTGFQTFNPFIAVAAGDLQVINGIYPLLTRTSQDGVPEPYLATKWTPSADHLTWTFTLRPGLKWSDGQPLTASDVAWTYNLIMTNSAAGTANGQLVSGFKSVTAPNATTVKITTKSPESNVPYVVDTIPVVPKHVWASKVKNLANFKNQAAPAVGYGPWKLTGYAVNQYATLSANPGFYAGAPAYKSLIVQYYSSSDAAVEALRSGSLDEIDDLSAAQFESLKHASGVATYPTVSNIWNAIEVNRGAHTKSGKKFGNGNPLLANPAVRRALALSVNRPELVTKVLDGLGEPGAGYLTPAYKQWWWTPSASESNAYNPAEANKILDAAGFKKGKGGIRADPKTHKPLTFRLGIHSDTASDSQVAPYLVEWAQKVGIKLNVQSMSYDQLNSALPDGNWDILMDSWNESPDPSYLLSIQNCSALPAKQSTPGLTDSFFCDPAYDKLYKRQLTEFSQSQRVQTINKMQDILYKANSDIILYYHDNLEAVRTASVKDYFYGQPDAKGFYPIQNDYLNWAEAKPAAASSGGGSSAAVEIGIPVIVVILAAAGGLVALRRRKTAGERE